MKKILLIKGSPHRSGNTAAALKIMEIGFGSGGSPYMKEF